MTTPVISQDHEHAWENMLNEKMPDGEYCPSCGSIKSGEVVMVKMSDGGWLREDLIVWPGRSGLAKPPLTCAACDGRGMFGTITGDTIRCPQCYGTGTAPMDQIPLAREVYEAGVRSAKMQSQALQSSQADPSDRITAIVLAMNSAPWSRHEAIIGLQADREAYARRQVVAALEGLKAKAEYSDGYGWGVPPECIDAAIKTTKVERDA